MPVFLVIWKKPDEHLHLKNSRIDNIWDNTFGKEGGNINSEFNAKHYFNFHFVLGGENILTLMSSYLNLTFLTNEHAP